MLSVSMKKSLQKYAFGQILSTILAATGLINGWLFEVKGLNIPATQAALTYTLILIGSSIYLFSESRKVKVAESGKLSLYSLMMKYKRILLGSVLFDVAANWLVVKAFSELKIPEVMVFSGLSTPAAIVMALIWTRPRPKYTRLQVTGVISALMAIFFYFYLSQKDAMTRSVMGIVCAVFSAFSYAASNNFQERVAQVMRPVEFLFGLGSIGSLISWLVVCVSFDEVETFFKSIFDDFSVLIFVFVYGTILSSFYLLIPVYMSKHSAVSFNFSLLTANFLGIFGSWLLLEASYSNWLYMSVALINFGLLLYYFGEETTQIQDESKGERV
jgi:drug/metabolite transporter (DMT)-like permease